MSNIKKFRIKFFKEKKSILQLEKISLKFGRKIILDNLSLKLNNGQILGLLGPNGVGKTTLLNLLINNIKEKEGNIYRHHALKIAYYNQHFINILPLEKTPIEYLQEVSNDYKEQELRQMLGIIGLEGYNHKKIMGELSGGQKARVVLVYCQILKPHLLIMDEPTNHLDIETINGLIEGINKFKGGIILVTHDMELIMETNSELWALEHKKLYKFNGDYEDYKEKLLNI